MPTYSQLIYRVVTSDESYVEFIDVLGTLERQDQKQEFFNLVKYQFDTAKIWDTVGMFYELGLDVEIEERHWEEANRYEDRELFRMDYASHLAKTEWMEKKHDDLKAILEYVLKYVDTRFNDAEIDSYANNFHNCLPFKKAINPRSFESFMDELRQSNYISYKTKIQDFRNIFGLRSNGTLTHGISRKENERICWSGSNFALKKLINELEYRKYLKFDRKKWDNVRRCFKKENEDLTEDKLRTSRSASKEDAAKISDVITNATKKLALIKTGH